MRYLLGLLMVLLLWNCNNAPKNNPKTTTASIDLTNKGIGPVTHLEFDSIVDINMAERGDKIFGAKCTSCHMEESKLIGPAMKGIYERRSPEWVMNIMLNPIEMLKKDRDATALLKEYNNVLMLNQNLTMEEARAIAEYLRTL